MTAHPAYDSESEDPIEILHVLPEEYHAQFRAEYAVAVDAARRPEHFHRLQDMLRLWRLRAAASPALATPDDWQTPVRDTPRTSYRQ